MLTSPRLIFVGKLLCVSSLASSVRLAVCDTDRLTRELARDLFRSVQGTPVDFLTFAEFCEVSDTPAMFLLPMSAHWLHRKLESTCCHVYDVVSSHVQAVTAVSAVLYPDPFLAPAVKLAKVLTELQ
jgi:hypothetical protein